MTGAAGVGKAVRGGQRGVWRKGVTEGKREGVWRGGVAACEIYHNNGTWDDKDKFMDKEVCC